MKHLSRTTLRELKKRYLNVLKKCFLANLMAFGMVTLSTPATAGEDALYMSDSNLIKEYTSDVTFENLNSQTNAWCGGAAIHIDAGTLEFKNSSTVFKNNSEPYGYGGAINNSGTITFGADSTATFTGNSAYDGGAIENYDGTITFGGEATFTGNSATGDYSYGGAIENYRGTITFGGEATFTDNSASDYGGAIYNYDNSTITFNDNFLFSGNTAEYQGADIYNDNYATINFAHGEGKVGTLDGGIYQYYGSSKINKTGAGTLVLGDKMVNGYGTNYNSQFNQSLGLTIAHADKLTFAKTNTITGGELRVHGASLANLKASVSNGAMLTYLTTNANEQVIALHDGLTVNGAILTLGAYTEEAKNAELALVADKKVPKLDSNGEVEYDTNGDIVYVSYDAGSKLLTTGTIDRARYNLTSDISGAAKVIFKDSDVTIASGTYNASYDFDNAQISNSTSNSITFNGNMLFKDGSRSAIYNDYGTITFGGKATFTGNSDGWAGGAFENSGTITFGGDATFMDNSAHASGAVSNAGDVDFVGNAIFTNNYTSQYGAAIGNWGGNITFGGNATFTNNIDNNRVGGAIYNHDYATITFNDNFLFSGNTTEYQGADIYNTGTINFAQGEGKVGTLDGGIYQAYVNNPKINKTGAGTLILGDEMDNGYDTNYNNSQFNQSLGLTIAHADKLTFAETNTITGGELRVHGASLAGLKASVSSGAMLTYLTTNASEQTVALPRGLTVNGAILTFGAYTDEAKNAELALVADKKVPKLDSNGEVEYDTNGDIVYVSYDAGSKLLTTDTIDRARYNLTSDISGATKVIFKDSDVTIASGTYNTPYDFENARIANANTITFNGNTRFKNTGSSNYRYSSIDNNGTITFGGRATAIFTSNSEYSGRAIDNHNGTITFGENSTAIFTSNSEDGMVYNYSGTITFGGDATFINNSSSDQWSNRGVIDNNYGGTITFNDNFLFSGNTANRGADIYNDGGTIDFAQGEGKVGILDGGIYQSNGTINKTGLGTLILGDRMDRYYSSTSQFNQSAGLTIARDDNFNFDSTNTITGGELRVHGNYLGALKASVSNGAMLTYLSANAYEQNISLGGVTLNNAILTLGAYTDEAKNAELALVADKKVPKLDSNGEVVYDTNGNIVYETYDAESKLLTTDTIDRAKYNLTSDISGATKVIFKDSDVTIASGTYNASYDFENARITNANSITFNGNTRFKNTGSYHGYSSIDNNNGTITFGENSTAIFTSNSEYSGRAIDNHYGTIRFGKDSTATFTGNTSSLYGGAIYNNRGTITFDGDATFTGKSASYGGAIENYGSNSKITFNGDVTFTGNSASVGGAIDNDHGPITFGADSSVYFNNNTANGVANDIYNNYGTINILGEVKSDIHLISDRGTIGLKAKKTKDTDTDGKITYTGSYKLTNTTLDLSGDGVKEVTIKNLTGSGASLIIDALFTKETDGSITMTADKLNSANAYQFNGATVNMAGQEVLNALINELKVDQSGNIINPEISYTQAILGGNATLKYTQTSQLTTTSPYIYQMVTSGQDLTVSARKLASNTTALEYLNDTDTDVTLQIAEKGDIDYTVTEDLGTMGCGKKQILGSTSDATESVINASGKDLFTLDKADTELEMKDLTITEAGTAIDNQAGKAHLENVVIEKSDNETALANGAEMTLKDVSVDKGVVNSGKLTMSGNNALTTLTNSGETTVEGGKLSVTTLGGNGTLTMNGAELDSTNIATNNTIVSNGMTVSDRLSTLGVKSLEVKDGTTLDLNLALTTADKIKNEGDMIANKDLSVGVLEGSGTLTVNNATLDVADKFKTTNKIVSNGMKIGDNVTSEIHFADLEIKDNTTLDIKTLQATANTVTVGENATLGITLKNLDEYGTMKADEIVAKEDSKVHLTLGDNFAGGVFDVFKGTKGSGDLELVHNNVYNVVEVSEGKYSFMAKDTEALQESLGTTDNETVIANALTQGTTSHAVFSRMQSEMLVALQSQNKETVAKAKKALNALGARSTSVYQSQATAQFTQMHTVITQMLMNSTAPIFGHAGGEEPARATVYVKGLYDRVNSLAGDGFRMRSKGAVLGVQSAITEDLTVGIGYAGINSVAKEPLRRTEVDTNTGFISAQYQPNNWWVNGVVTYSRSQYDEEKNILSTKGSANYDVDSLGAQITTGYNIKRGNWIVTPEVGIRYLNARQEGYVDSLGTTVEKTTSDFVTTMAGFKVGVDLGWMRPLAGVMVGYDVVTDDISAVNTLISGATYTIKGKALDRLSTTVVAGFAADIADNATLKLEYSGNYRKEYLDHSGMGRLEWKF